ncbi:MAG: hypothetical protein GX205_02660 [Firmicutes bacterium]|nr:hypothetical protein [Bacillota bacterium]
MNKRVMLGFVLAVLLFTLGAAPVAANLSDVPSDHWAYHAVVTLVNKGYLAVYEDGTFQGSRPVDRYTLAVTLARILDDIEAGRVQGSMEDLTLIRELTTELTEELVAWYSDRAALEDKVSNAERMLVITEDRLNRVVTAQTQLQDEVAAIKNELMQQMREEAALLETATAEQATTLSAQQALLARQGEIIGEHSDVLSEHEMRINEQMAQLREQQVRLGELMTALMEIENSLMTHKADINALQNWAGEKSAVLAALQHQDAALNEEVAQIRTELASLTQETDERLSELSAMVSESDAEHENTAAQIAALQARSVEIEKDLQNLAVLLQRETQRRGEMSTAIDQIRAEMASLETQIGLSEEEMASLRSQISDQVRLEMNAALIREQRLERQIDELQEEFANYKQTTEAQLKSNKTMATIGIVVGAIGVVVGLINK